MCVSVCVWAVVDDESTRHMRARVLALSVEQTQACVCVCVCVCAMMIARVRGAAYFFPNWWKGKTVRKICLRPQIRALLQKKYTENRFAKK